MSDAPGFDTTVLEGKDRAELAAIAEQLGEKPGARAKKADIVALILRLVGAEGGEADEAAAPAAEHAGAAGAAAGQADHVASESGADGDDRPAAEGQPSAADGRRGGGRQQGGREQGGREQGGRGQGGRPDQQQGQHPDQDQGSADGDDDTDEHNRADQGNGSANGNGNAGPGDQQDEGDSGNRRRRRRGRDRGRGEGEEQVHVEPIEVEGMVDLREEGYGFLRLNGYLPSREDAYISVKQTRQFGLRTGDIVRGKSRPANRNERNPALIQVEGVNGHPAHSQPPRPRFDELTPVSPDERLTLELADDPANATVRIIDLLAPIGKGTRGLIASPPRSGKTTVLKHIVRSIEVNHPDVELIVLLVDERPEEVTEMARWLLRGTVAASTFDRPSEEHTAVAELVIERAKRLVESGKDVVVVLDGITRLTRAYNLAAPAGGRTLDGVLETSALFPPKRFFGAARKAEEGGSLTVVATAQVETGSRLDELIFDELEGTGTMELRLDRHLAERRAFPAIDLDASSTRHEELLVDRDQLEQVAVLRQKLGELRAETGSNLAGLEWLTERLASSKSNAELLATIAKG